MATDLVFVPGRSKALHPALYYPRTLSWQVAPPPLLRTPPGQDDHSLQEPVRGSGHLGTVSTLLHPHRLRAGDPQCCRWGLAFNNSTGLQLPLQEVLAEAPSTVRPYGGVRCSWLTCSRELLHDGSDRLCTGARRGPSLETPEAAPSCGHGYLLFLLREHLDRNLDYSTELQPRHVESTWRLPDADPTILQHRWRMAPRVQLHALLQQPYDLEVPGLPESRAGTHRRQAGEETDAGETGASSTKVDPLRSTAAADCWLVRRLFEHFRFLESYRKYDYVVIDILPYCITFE